MLARVKRAWSSYQSSRADARVQSLEGALRVASLRLAAAREKAAMVSGVKITWGRYNYEDNPELSGPSRWKTLRRMTTDAHVKGAIRHNTLPLVQAQWCFEPASDKPKDVEIAEFCSANLLRQGGDLYGKDYWCLTPWRAQRLPEILTMLPYGFAMFGKSWRTQGTKRVYDRIQWMEPSSVDPHGWQLDPTNDDIVQVLRTYRNPEGGYAVREPLGVDRIALYPWEMIGARYEGEPFTRPMYGAWYRKDQMLRAALTWAAKTGNPPPVGFYPTSFTPDDVAKFTAYVQMLRGIAPDEAWGVFPMGPDGQVPSVTYPGTDKAEVDRMRGLITGENQEIAHAGSTVTMQQGETGHGSRAASQAMSPFEKMEIQAIADIVCEWEMHGVSSVKGLVEELVEVNFGASVNIPKLTVRGIDPVENTQYVPSMIDAIKGGALPALPCLQYQIAERLGFEVEEDELDQAAADQKVADAAAQQAKTDALNQQNAPPQDGGPAADGEGNDAASQDGEPDSASMSAGADAMRSKLADMLTPMQPGAPKGSLRYPNKLEAQYANLAAVRDAFRVGEQSVLTVLRGIQRSMVEEIVGRVRAGKITRRNLNGFLRSNFRGASKAVAALLPILRTTGMTGARHVSEELARQQASPKRAALADSGPDVRVGGLRLKADSLSKFEDEARLAAEIDVDAIWQRMITEAAGELTRLERQGVAGDSLVSGVQAFLEGLSSKPIEDTARKSAGVAYNEGRDVAIQTGNEGGMVDYVLRSEVLDSNTCPTCASYDGKIVEVGTDSYDAYMPPAGCDGGDRCRGFYVLIGQDVAGRGE